MADVSGRQNTLRAWLEQLPIGQRYLLEGPLTEFKRLCLEQDFDAAARLLAVILPQTLVRWGNHKLIVILRQRLVSEIKDPALASSNLGELGSAYAMLGQVDKAIDFQRQALALAELSGDAHSADVWRANLGNRFLSQGNFSEARRYFGAALTGARRRNDPQAEVSALVAMGTCDAQTGQYSQAIELLEDATRLARETRNISAEGFALSNLANVYTVTGQPVRAIALFDQAISIARDQGGRIEESRRLGGLAEALAACEQYAEAIEHLRLGLQIDEEMGYTRGKSFKGATLTRVYLLVDDLASARRSIDEARAYDVPQNNPEVLALFGVVLLREGNPPGAGRAFSDAIDAAEKVFRFATPDPAILLSWALASAGTALASGPMGVHRDNAVAIYRQAQNAGAGLGQLRLAARLIRTLAPADPAGGLSEVCDALEDMLRGS